MISLLPLATFLTVRAPTYVAALLAQTSGGSNTNPLDLRSIAIYYGVAAPLVIYLLFDSRRKDQRIDALEKRNAELVDASFDKIVPLATEMTQLARDAGTAAVRRTRGLDDEDVARIAAAVRHAQ